jgi:hypothetical protein
MKTNFAPIADKKLWDSLGNYCRVELYSLGSALDGGYELYLTDFNGSIPRRFTGGLSELISRGDLFIAAKKANGFIEQLPSYNPEAWRA